MKLNNVNIAVFLLLLFALAMGCSDEPENSTSSLQSESRLENVKNEGVKSALQNILNDTIREDDIPNSETQKEVLKLKETQIKNFTKKVNASTFKGSSDDEIKEHLMNQLNAYEQSCDSAIVNQVFRQMGFDQVLIIFNERQTEFSRAYYKKLLKAKNACK